MMKPSCDLSRRWQMGFLRGGAWIVLDKIQQAVFPNDEPQVAAGFLRPIDTARIARTLDLERAAADKGRRNLPPTDADVPDEIEQKILQQIEAEWTWHGSEFINHLRAYASRLVGYSIHAEFERVQLLGSDALARLRSAHHRAEAELGHLLKAYREFSHEFEQFRRRHRLTRPPRDPPHRWTTFGLLFVLIALESVFNGLFFAKGSEFGIVGGIGTAIGISFTNVVIAFALGLWPCRWLNHRNMLIKFVGGVLVLASAAALIGLHAFAAQLRDATSTGVDEDQAVRIAIDRLLTTPWVVASLTSIYLFALGVVFGFLALWKGYNSDDPYPAFGGHARRSERARETYTDEHDAVFEELDEIKDKTIKEIETAINRIPLYPQQAARIRAERSALLQTFRAYEAAVESAANQLLAQYRGVNRELRSAPAPVYFNQRWKLPHSFLSSAEVAILVAEPSQPALNIEDALAQLRTLSKGVLAEYENLFLKYPHASRIT